MTFANATPPLERPLLTKSQSFSAKQLFWNATMSLSAVKDQRRVAEPQSHLSDDKINFDLSLETGPLLMNGRVVNVGTGKLSFFSVCSSFLLAEAQGRTRMNYFPDPWFINSNGKQRYFPSAKKAEHKSHEIASAANSEQKIGHFLDYHSIRVKVERSKVPPDLESPTWQGAFR